MSSHEGWTAAKLGTQLDVDDAIQSPAPWWTKHISDPEVLRALLIMREAFDQQAIAAYAWWFGADIKTEDIPPTFEETRAFRKIFHAEAGMTVDAAIRHHDVDRQSALIGLDRIETVEGVGSLVDRMDPGYIAYIKGQMGTGKTHFAFRVAELYHLIHGTGTIGSNVQSLGCSDDSIPIVHFERFDRLEEWVRRDGRKLFVYDEASSTGSGYSADAHEIMSAFRELLQAFRKNDSMLLIIGHTGKDVHPHIVRQCNDVINKPDKKTAEIYEDVDDNGEGVDLKVEIDEISGLRLLEFDTREFSRWFWDS